MKRPMVVVPGETTRQTQPKEVHPLSGTRPFVWLTCADDHHSHAVWMATIATATLELAIGFLTPGADTADLKADSPSVADQSDNTTSRFRVVAHLNRDGHGARLVPNVTWADMWSVRLFVTGLLRNIGRSGLVSPGSRCWCEVWTPNESGELVDSAFLDPDTAAIDWESDPVEGDDGS